MFLGNMYFPYTEVPELFLAFRVMVTLMSARQIQKISTLFASDVDFVVTERPDDPVDETLFHTLFGK